MKKLINGFNEKCSNEEYHADREYKSSSALKMILKDPRQYYKNYILNESVNMNKDALSIGSYTHTRILEPHLVDVEYAIYEGGRRSGKDWEDFKEANADKTIITSSQKNMVDTMLDSFEEAEITLGNHGHEEQVKISSFFVDGFPEETLCGEINGYKVKTRFDYRKVDTDFASINDVKTTGEPLSGATVKDVEEICNKWGYDVSAALYADLATQETGQKHDFYFMFLSKKDYACRIFKASETMLERGRKKYLEAIEVLKEAEKTGIYFSNKIQELR